MHINHVEPAKGTGKARTSRGAQWLSQCALCGLAVVSATDAAWVNRFLLPRSSSSRDDLLTALGRDFNVHTVLAVYRAGPGRLAASGG